MLKFYDFAKVEFNDFSISSNFESKLSTEGAWTELSTGRINSKTHSGGYTLEQTIVCRLRGVGERD